MVAVYWTLLSVSPACLPACLPLLPHHKRYMSLYPSCPDSHSLSPHSLSACLPTLSICECACLSGVPWCVCSQSSSGPSRRRCGEQAQGHALPSCAGSGWSCCGSCNGPSDDANGPHDGPDDCSNGCNGPKCAGRLTQPNQTKDLAHLASVMSLCCTAWKLRIQLSTEVLASPRKSLRVVHKVKRTVCLFDQQLG